MIKAVFLDIDGTMVPFGEKEIRPSLTDAFDRLHEAGIKVIVASGRSRLLIKNLRDYPFDGYITVNGGLAVMDGKVLCSETLQKGRDPQRARAVSVCFHNAEKPAAFRKLRTDCMIVMPDC